MSRNPSNRLNDNLIPGASIGTLLLWLREEITEYEQLKGRSSLKSFRSAARRRIEAIRQELADRGEDIPSAPASPPQRRRPTSGAAGLKSTQRTKKEKQQIMYIEAKPGLTGHARIGRVRMSKSGKTLYYRRMVFQSLKGAGYKANYYNVETGVHYWISNCHHSSNN